MTGVKAVRSSFRKWVAGHINLRLVMRTKDVGCMKCQQPIEHRNNRIVR
jgi:hypothetical protein